MPIGSKGWRGARAALAALGAALLALPVGVLSGVAGAPAAGATQSQTITWLSTPPSGAVVGDTYDVSASAPGGSVSFSVPGTASTVCAISGATVSFTGVGTCEIDASQSGSSVYAAATSTQSVVVGAAPQTQTITWSTTLAATASVGTSDPLSATASSGLPVTITISSGSTTVCSYSAGVVDFTAAGTCTIVASVSASATYLAATTEQNVTVDATAGTGSSGSTAAQPQTITFNPASVTGATVGGSTPLAATATSGGVVTLTVDTSATAECSLSSGTVAFLAAGTCVVDASVAGTTSYAPANAQWSTTISAPVGGSTSTAALAGQTVSFAPSPPTSALIGTTATLSATASSGLPVALTIAPASAGVCSIGALDVVSFLAAGTCTVDATQSGNSSYQPANASVNIAVQTGTTSQSVSFTSTAPLNAIVGGNYTPTATSSAGLPVAIAVSAGAAAVCSLAGGVVTFIQSGTCVLDASQAGDGTYAAADTQQSISVSATGSTGSAGVQLILGGGSGAIDLSGLTAAQAGTDLSATSFSLALPLAAGNSLISIPALTIPSATITTSATALSITGTAQLPFGSLPVMFTATWSSASATAPAITFGVRTTGLALSTIDPAWTGATGAVVGDGEIIYASAASTFDPNAAPGAAGFYAPALCGSGATTITLAPGANFCGSITASASSPLASALSALGLSLQTTLTGTLGGPAVLFGAASASALDGLQLTGTFAATATGPSWLSSAQLVATFSVVKAHASLSLQGELNTSIDGTVDNFSGTLQVASSGAISATLDAAGPVALPFGLGALASTASASLDLTTQLHPFQLAASLLVTSTPAGASASVGVLATLSDASGSTTATLAVGSPTNAGTLGPLTAQSMLALAGAIFGVSAPSVPAVDALSLNDASLTLSSVPSPSGTGRDKIATFGASTTLGGLQANALLSLRDDNGTAVPLVGVQVGQPGCTTACGTALSSLFPDVPLNGMLGSIVLPTVAFTAAGSAVSIPSADLTAEETRFFTAVDGTLPATIDVPSGLSLSAQLPTNIFGSQLAALFGYDGNQTVVLSGTLGGSLDLSSVGTPGVNVTGIALSASLPATTSAPQLLSGLVSSVGATTFQIGYSAGTLDASLDTSAKLALAGETIPVTLSASGSLSSTGGTVTVDAAIPAWQHPFGLSWIPTADASVAITASDTSGGTPSFSASVTADFTLSSGAVTLPFTLSGALDLSNTAALTLSASSTGSATLAQLSTLLPDVGSLSTQLSQSPVLAAVSLGAMNLTLVVSNNPSITFAAQGSVTLPGDSSPVTGEVLIDASPSSFTFGLQIAGLSLADVLPPGTLAGANEIVLPNSAVVLTDATTPIAASALSPDEYNFFKTLYGCPADATLTSCTDFNSLTLGSGLTFMSSMDMPTVVSQEASKLGLQLPAPGSGAVLTVQGTLPLFSSSSVFSLTASVSHLTIPGAPEWFPSGGAQLSISTQGVSLTGDVTITLPRALAPAGSPCDNGGTMVDFGGTSLCSDSLQFAVSLAVTFPTSGDPSIALSGTFQDLNGTGAGTATYWYPFGLPGFGMHRLGLSISVTMEADGPNIGIGMQGDINVAGNDVAGAIDIGLEPIPDPPFVIPSLLGISGASASGLSLGGLVNLASAFTGSSVSSANLAGLPDVGLKNLSFQFAQVTNAALCLQTGFHFSADLYVQSSIQPGSGTIPPIFVTPDGCRQISVPPGPSSDCHANASNGCLASVFGTVDTSGVLASGELNAFTAGLISFQKSTLELSATLTKQSLTLVGGASITASDGYPIASGYANLDFGLSGLTYTSNASMFDGTLRGYVQATAPFDLTNPNFNFQVWLSADVSAAINGAIASALNQLKPIVVDINNVVQSMNTNGGIPQFSTFGALAQDIANATGTPVSPLVTGIISAAASIQQALAKAGLQPNLDWILNGVQITPPIYVPAVTLIPALPGIPGIYTPPGCDTGASLIGYPYCGGFFAGRVPPPGLCAFVFVNGTCYSIPPTPAVVIPAYTIPALQVPGLCADLSIPSANCSWSGLLATLLTPALDAVDNATGLTLTSASPTQAIDQLTSYFTSSAPSVVDLSCAYFSASGSNLLSLQSGAAAVTMAASGSVFGTNFSGGLTWNLGDLTSPGTLVKQLLNELFHPAPTTCPTEPTTALLTSATTAPPPTETITGGVTTPSVKLGTSVQFSASFGTPQASYPAVVVDWGDGTTTTIPAGAAATVTASHTYASAGASGAASAQYSVVATVQDAGKDQISSAVTVTSPPPAISSLSVAAPTVAEGQQAQLAGTFTDANAGDTIAVSVNWGDGSPVQVLSLAPGVRSFSADHAYDDPSGASSYPIAATVTDQHLGTATATTTEGVSEALPSGITLTPTAVLAGVGGAGTNGFDVVEGATVQYQLAFNDPATTDAHAVTIDWGDGSTPSSLSLQPGTVTAVVSHQYVHPGRDVPQVTVVDSDPGSATTDTPVSTVTDAVSVADAPLTAGAPTVIAPTEGNAFQGVVATFTDGNPISTASEFQATIDWGDGTTSVGTVSGGPGGPFSVAGTHTYVEEGPYTTSVAVSDDGGATVTVAGAAESADAPLSAGSTITISPIEGNAFAGTVATFTDANPGANVSDFTATITWGDGKTSAGTVVAGNTPGAFSVAGTHTYAEEGPYTTSVALSDVGGASATLAGAATVSDAPLSPGDAITIKPVEGNAFAGTVTTFTDANPGATVSDFTATITWGDGKTSAGTVVAGNTPGAFSVAGTHTYAEEGPYTTSVALSDVGGASATLAGAATTADAPLSAGSAITIKGNERSAFSPVVATFTDANPGATVSDFTATITWGDGKTSAGTIVAGATPGAFSVAGTHTYAEEGSYTTSVALSDVGGSSATLPGAARITVITQTALSSALTPKAVDFTATVSPSDATGTVTFYTSFDGQSPAPISGCAALALSATTHDVAAATCPVLALPPGDNEVSAQYSGDTPTGYFRPSETAMTTAQTIQALCATPPAPVGVGGDGSGGDGFAAPGADATSGGVIEGTIDGDLHLRGAVTFVGQVTVKGDVSVQDGSLTMSCGSIAGDLEGQGSNIVLSGGPTSIGQGLHARGGSGLLLYGTQVADDLQVQDTTASSGAFAVCGTSVGGLQIQNSTFATPPTLGGAPATICGPDQIARDVELRGDTFNGLNLANLPIGGGLQIAENNLPSGSLTLAGDTIGRDVQLSDNAVPAGSLAIDGATVIGDLQLQRNQVADGLTLSSDTVERDLQLSDNAVPAGSLAINGAIVTGDLQLQRNAVGDSISVSASTVGRDLQVERNTASTGSISVLDNLVTKDAVIHANVAPLGVVIQGNTVGRLITGDNGTPDGSGSASGPPAPPARGPVHDVQHSHVRRGFRRG